MDPSDPALGMAEYQLLGSDGFGYHSGYGVSSAHGAAGQPTSGPPGPLPTIDSSQVPAAGSLMGMGIDPSGYHPGVPRCGPPDPETSGLHSQYPYGAPPGLPGPQPMMSSRSQYGPSDPLGGYPGLFDYSSSHLGMSAPGHQSLSSPYASRLMSSQFGSSDQRMPRAPAPIHPMSGYTGYPSAGYEATDVWGSSAQSSHVQGPPYSYPGGSARNQSSFPQPSGDQYMDSGPLHGISSASSAPYYGPPGIPQNAYPPFSTPTSGHSVPPSQSSYYYQQQPSPAGPWSGVQPSPQSTSSSVPSNTHSGPTSSSNIPYSPSGISNVIPQQPGGMDYTGQVPCVFPDGGQSCLPPFATQAQSVEPNNSEYYPSDNSEYYPSENVSMQINSQPGAHNQMSQHFGESPSSDGLLLNGNPHANSTHYNLFNYAFDYGYNDGWEDSSLDQMVDSLLTQQPESNTLSQVTAPEVPSVTAAPCPTDQSDKPNDDIQVPKPNQEGKEEKSVDPKRAKVTKIKQPSKKKAKTPCLKSFVCSKSKKCLTRFITKEGLEIHEKCHAEGQNSFVCFACNEFQNGHWPPVAGHLWRKHSIDADLYKCGECSYKSYSQAVIENIHKKIHSNEKNHVCTYCQKAFKNKKQLINHKVRHGPKQSPPPPEPDPVLEPDSPVVPSPSEVTPLLELQLNPSHKKCPICGHEYENLRAVKIHMNRIHQNCRPFSCTSCTYQSSSRSALRTHLRSHTGEKPFKCDECSYVSSDHNSLRRHKMRHSGERPYKCPLCPYACIQVS